jgi:hypothetical protein
MPTCKIQKIYPTIECTEDALEDDPEGLCILHSRQEDKEKNGTFTSTVKAKLEKEDYDFRAVFFPGPFSLGKLTRQGKFTFTKPADFAEATFTGKVDFSMATFKGLADFSGATFKGAALYRHSTFEEADFSEANLKKADFTLATFKGRTQFTRATFSGEARFVKINYARESEQPSIFSGEFVDLTLDHEADLLFRDVSLARVGFAETEVFRLTFRNVVWHPCHSPVLAWLIKKLPSRWQERFRGRQAVYEEILLRERAWKLLGLFLKYGHKAARRILTRRGEMLRQIDNARVEELYRGLKLNYGKAGDYNRVGDFHYGEMEMHRKASIWRRWFSWYSLYWALSGYGERPVRALIWLGAFLFGLSGLVWGLGLSILKTGEMAGFWEAFIYILQKATLQRPEWAAPVTFGGWFLISISVLLLPGQAALFLLALRNRLGRRR